MRAKIVKASAGKGKLAVECIATKGVTLCIFGGNVHTLAQSRWDALSLGDRDKLSATSSVLAVVGHKEDELVKASFRKGREKT